MAASFTCDGCGTSIAEPKKAGHFVARDYCATCHAIAKRFLGCEEELRTALVDRFKVERAILVEKFRADLASLPDTP